MLASPPPSLCVAVFSLIDGQMRTMTVVFFPPVVQDQKGPARNYFLLGLGLVQLPITMFLGRAAYT
jgi:hypothetical protein